MKHPILRNLLILSDFASAMIAWFVFYFVRKIVLHEQEFSFSSKLYIGLIIIPIFWLIIYLFQGTYHQSSRLYRMRILQQTLSSTFIGAIILFFVLLLDDVVQKHTAYYLTFFGLIICHFLITFIPRYFLVLKHVQRIHNRKFGFNTLMIGGGKRALEIEIDLKKLKRGTGNNFIGFLNANGSDFQLSEVMKHVGDLNNLESVIEKEQIDEIIIAIENEDQYIAKEIIHRIFPYNVRIKLAPSAFNERFGEIETNNIFGAVLIEVKKDCMPVWQIVTKRILDIVASFIAMILLIPFYLFLAFAVKTSSKGSVFFLQERIGLHGNSFKIIKFRTMVQNAESTGPQLSSAQDPRVTKVGRWMRKLRFDEFPQFFNVLIGDMSLVGPRPERQFFIEKITQVAPQYRHLTSVRPGITSWGQVKFGYAENVDEMLQRMKYDLLYLKNRSLALDFKILLHTVLIIFRAEGK